MSYIIHCFGKTYDTNKDIIQSNINTRITLSPDISLISAMNESCAKDSVLMQQCATNNLPLHVPKDTYNIDKEHWDNTLKIASILSELENIHTNYVLILDGKDTALLKNIDQGFIDKFLSMDCDIVFNGGHSIYPPDSFLDTNVKFLNAGVCFGTKEAMKQLYSQCLAMSKVRTWVSPYNNQPSEQYIVKLAAKYSPLKIKVDIHQQLFCNPLPIRFEQENSMLDIKIYGIQERCDNILQNKELLHLSDNDIFIKTPQERTLPHDKWPYKACKNAFTQSVPIGVTHRLVLQDDVTLAPNFLEYVNRAIAAQPNAIFMLTALDYQRERDCVKDFKTPYVTVTRYVSGCALVIPVRYIGLMFAWLESKFPQIGIGKPHEDSAIFMFAQAYKIPCLTTIPSLVQHNDGQSSVCTYHMPLQTAYFSDWDKVNWDCKEVAQGIPDTDYIAEQIAHINDPVDDDTIHYFVRTTGERPWNYYPLKTKVLYDYKHQPVDSFIEHLETISKYNAVLMEDDLILCKDFQKEIEAAIAQYPDKIINFFSQPGQWATTYIQTFPFTWNQCTYYPKGVAKQVAAAMRKIRGRFPLEQKLYSQVEDVALRALCIPHVFYRPCLVQHNDNNTILDSPRPARRDTLYFKDYLDEAGIKYEDAWTKENFYKLLNIRNKHVEQLEAEYAALKKLQSEEIL